MSVSKDLLYYYIYITLHIDCVTHIYHITYLYLHPEGVSTSLCLRQPPHTTSLCISKTADSALYYKKTLYYIAGNWLSQTIKQRCRAVYFDVSQVSCSPRVSCCPSVACSVYAVSACVCVCVWVTELISVVGCTSESWCDWVGEGDKCEGTAVSRQAVGRLCVCVCVFGLCVCVCVCI